MRRTSATPRRCAPRWSLQADARERGVRYRGSGNEPGWIIEVGPGTRLEFGGQSLRGCGTALQ